MTPPATWLMVMVRKTASERTTVAKFPSRARAASGQTTPVTGTYRRLGRP